jgi:cytochrome c553
MTRVYVTSLALACALSSLAPVHAGGDAAAGKQKAVICAACHGVDGNSVNPIWPKLAGQHEVYLAKQIRAFRSGERKDPTMAPMVSILKEEDIDDVAAYYASQTPK